MTENNLARERWKEMVENEEKVTLSARDIDRLLSTIFSLQSAVFETIASVNYSQAGEDKLAFEHIKKSRIAAGESLALLSDYPQALTGMDR